MKKRSITLKGHRTSVTLEPEFWAGLQTLAAQHHKSLQKLVETIDATRKDRNLSSALRVFVLENLQKE